MTAAGADMMNFDHLISDRARGIDVSGIRRVFELGAKLRNPINLSIGQPDFPVPDVMKEAAIRAIRENRNGYTLTQGSPDIVAAISRHLTDDVGWTLPSDDLSLLVTTGTSGALQLAFLALLNPGDEVVAADPYFVAYQPMARIAGATLVLCDTYPDFRLTAERVERALTSRTKIVLVNSPSNPCGSVLSSAELRELVDLCEKRGIVMISDEIYDQFIYSDAVEDGRCPSPARMSDRVLLIRGFGKTYGCTGWRMGYIAGPTPLIRQIAKLQQYTYVCAPSMAQAACAVAFDVDMSPQVREYERRRDIVMSGFDGVAQVVRPGGAFYAFVQVPPHLGLSASSFVEKAIENNVLIIPGKVFSRRDTHFRLSFAVAEQPLRNGLDVLRGLMKG